jgi:hypothetical protein
MLEKNGHLFLGIIKSSESKEIAVLISHPIGACCLLSGQIHAFNSQKCAHLQDHMLMVHTVRPIPLEELNCNPYCIVQLCQVSG